MTARELDWRKRPGDATISTMLLHVAGVELALTAVVAGRDAPAEISREAPALWSRLRSGFPRILDVPGSEGLSLQSHLELLGSVRAHCEATVASRGVTVGDLDWRTGSARLAAPTPEWEHVLPVLSEALRLHPTDWCMALVVHEAYHRGQITLLKYQQRR
ncbi:MAG: DinB family protein [Candidatus Binatia bacterium]